MDKTGLRKEALARRTALSKEECCKKSRVIAEMVMQLENFKKCNKVLLYAPIRNEVETKEVAQEARALKKEIYYPRVLGKEMEFYRVDEMTEFETSAYGIREPKPESTVALVPKKDDEILVQMPGAAFDKAGNRIGYGGGYYDKYLCWLESMVSSEQICKVAVAYECQMIEEGQIEKEPHDMCADYIITERKVYRI